MAKKKDKLYFFAKDKYKKLLSYVFVSKKDPIIYRMSDNQFNREKSIYYSESELKRINFPAGTTFELANVKTDGGCMHLSSNKKNFKL